MFVTECLLTASPKGWKRVERLVEANVDADARKSPEPLPDASPRAQQRVGAAQQAETAAAKYSDSVGAETPDRQLTA
jgi:hypothetical protein